MNLASKLSARWARIYVQPIDRLSCMQADFVNMAYSINPTTSEDYITRRWLLKMSRACLQALEKRLMDMIRVLYINPSKCFYINISKKINDDFVQTLLVWFSIWIFTEFHGQNYVANINIQFAIH